MTVRTLAFAFGITAMLAPMAAAQDFTCFRSIPGSSRTEAYFDLSLSDNDLVLHDRKRPVAAVLVDNGRNGRVFLRSDYIFLVFGPERRKGSGFIAGKAELSVVMMPRTKDAGAAFQLECRTANK